MVNNWEEVYAFLSCDRALYLKTMVEQWGVDVQKVAEIGVFQGRLSKRLRVVFPECDLFLIDPWKLLDLSEEASPISLDPAAYEEAYTSVQNAFATDHKVHILRLLSQEAAPVVPSDLDFVFIDGNHSYASVKTDLSLWAPKVRKGGIIAGHDYHADSWPGVVKAVDEFFQNETVVLGNDSIWMVRKSI
jgi:hypothetical protein